MSTSFARTRSTAQMQVVNLLAERWSIDPDKILFLNSKKPLEPWLNYEALTGIARQSGRFQSLSEHFATFVGGLKTVLHSATVIDVEGREYTRSGAAKLGETLDGEEVDVFNLAATRALRLAFDSAGFDPVKATAVIPIDLKLPPTAEQHDAAQEAQARIKDLRTIHALAARKGLIVASEQDPSTNDTTKYRAWLAEKFDGRGSAGGFSAADRAIAINELRQLPDVVTDADLRSH